MWNFISDFLKNNFIFIILLVFIAVFLPLIIAFSRRKKDKTVTEEKKESGQNDIERGILVVEDEKFLREMMIKRLDSEGFKAFGAIDGEEGLKKIKEEKPGLVLLDLVLPGIGGFDFLSKVKQDPETDKIPIIILSNLGQEEEIKRGMNLGAVDYLVKANFTPTEIIEKIKNIIK